MIRFASPEDRPQLMRLWQEAFGDSCEDTAFYFQNRHRDDALLLWQEGDAVAGMLTMLPAALVCSGGALPIRYVYAVATAQTFRRRGISTGLLEYAHTWMRQQGVAASVLAPATPELFAFYGARGYEACFYADQPTVSLPGDTPAPPGIVLSAATPSEYARIRNLGLAGGRPYVRWDTEALRFVLGSEQAAGGEAFCLRAPTGEACAICQHAASGHVRVVELIASGIRPRDALAALHARLRARRYTLRLPHGAWPGSPGTPLGMICPLSQLPPMGGAMPYLGLIKD